MESLSPLTASATARSVDRHGATSTIHLMVLDKVPITSTPTTLMELLSLTGPLVNISGHMQLDSLMMAIMQVGLATAPVPRTQVEPLLLLLDWITIVNLESPVDGKTTNELLLTTHCGTVMDVVQTIAAATRLGCRGFTGASHRKWVVTSRYACVPMKALPMKTCTWSWWRSSSSDLNIRD